MTEPDAGPITYKPMVAIVGRPNVGKSSLFNRLIGRREAVVTDIPGTTRDRILGDVSWNATTFTIIDTGGLNPVSEDLVIGKVRKQIEMAISEADLLIFMLDGNDGLTLIDEDIANWLRRHQKPVVTTVNKIDNFKREYSASEFHKLGLGEPSLISAYHNLGVHDLLDRIVSLLPSSNEDYVEENLPKIAILGRPNVGKSMLLNAVLGQERAIVSEIPGTTRDSLDTHFDYNNQTFILIDTAGIRKRGQVQRGIEKYSVLRSARAIQRCDIALLLMDASELATQQDATVFGYAMDGFKGIIAVINKWDLTPKDNDSTKNEAIKIVRRRLHFMPYVPICFTSALNREGIPDLMSQIIKLYRERHRRVPSGHLRNALMNALATKPPPSSPSRKVEIRDIRQVDSNPPTFLINVTEPRHVHFSYRRYLENHLRKTFNFGSTHLRLVLKRGN